MPNVAQPHPENKKNCLQPVRWLSQNSSEVCCESQFTFSSFVNNQSSLLHFHSIPPPHFCCRRVNILNVIIIREVLFVSMWKHHTNAMSEHLNRLDFCFDIYCTYGDIYHQVMFFRDVCYLIYVMTQSNFFSSDSCK